MVPITGTDRGIRQHVAVEMAEGGLTKPSAIMCEQVKSQRVDRFRRRKGTISDEILREVRMIAGRFIDAHRVYKGDA